ncbi:DUF4190 domain-containing protein [Streptomyces sp. NPDC058459]|uniref:DUF4190 domain-containing protein n=1 Tax=Streptomyces sp. NPDC058459 TaxID=3346508 RepID=UPI003661C34D
MTEQTQPDDGRGAAGQGAGSDPWAPPQGPSLQKHQQGPQDRTPHSVHDQATMAAMPAVGSGPHPGPAVPPQHSGPGVPPPPIAPHGPGVPHFPPPAPAHGAPTPPAGYGYPSYPGPQHHPGPQHYRGPQHYPGPPGYPGAPNPGGYPPPPAYGWPGVPMGPGPQNTAGTAALVLGILSIVLLCLYGVASMVLGVVAVILGVQGRRRADRGEATNRGQAQAGFVLGIIGIVMGVAVLAFVIGLFAFVQHREDSRPDEPTGTSYDSAPWVPAPASPRS